MCNVEKTEINEKEAGIGPFFKKTYHLRKTETNLVKSKETGKVQETEVLDLKWSGVGNSIAFL